MAVMKECPEQNIEIKKEFKALADLGGDNIRSSGKSAHI